MDDKCLAITIHVDDGGWTPLAFAAANGFGETLQLLVDWGTRENDAAGLAALGRGEGEYGRTPLHLAVVNRHAHAVRVLTPALAAQHADRAQTAQAQAPAQAQAQAQAQQAQAQQAQAGSGAGAGVAPHTNPIPNPGGPRAPRRAAPGPAPRPPD